MWRRAFVSPGLDTTSLCSIKEVLMSKDRESVGKEDLLRFLETPGVKKALSRTLVNEDKPFDDGCDYPQQRVESVTVACLQALKTPSVI